MKKKIAVIVFAVICSLALVMGLMACGDIEKTPSNPPAHVHGYAWTDNNDGTHSGHCSVSGCDKPDINKESHVWGSDNKCIKCKAAKPSGTEDPIDHSHVWAPGWTNNETHHWHECTANDCTLTDNSKKGGYGAHNTSGIGGVCSICGYKPSSTEEPPMPSVVEVQLVTIGQTSLSLDKGATATLSVTVLPNNATDKSVTWQSDKPNIANVDSNGKVTAVATGTAIITVSTKNEKSASCTVTVNESTDYEFTFYRNGYAITAYNGSAKNIVVPATYNNKSVIAIGTGNGDGLGYGAFETVDLPNSISEINARAFENCADLQSINIPSCTSIKSQAFAGCAKLAELVLPNTCISVESQIVKNCVALRKLVLPTMEYILADYFGVLSGSLIPSALKEVEVIGGAGIPQDGFKDCVSLTDIIIPNTVVSLPVGVFQGCIGLQNISLPFVGANRNTSNTRPATADSWMGGSPYAFGYVFGGERRAFARYTTPESTAEWTYQGASGFYDNSVYKYQYDGYFIPQGLKTVKITDANAISGYAFYNCKFTSAELSDTISSIERNAFYGCTSLTNITIPNSVTSIGESAFHGCTGLTSITIPHGVMSVGDYAFYYCTGLTNVNWNATNCTSAGSDSCPIFDGRSKLTTVNIGDNVTKIPSYAFYGCISLTSITIPNSVTSIGDYAFDGCGGLSNITVASGNTKYHSAGNCLIETDSKKIILGCKNSVIPVDEGVTEIGEHAFAYCDGLTNITIPNSITKIGMGAFYDCDSLANITIPFVGASLDGTSNTHFGYIFGASSYSSNSSCVPLSLKTVIITGGTSIGSNAFYNCTKLASITIPDSATDIAGGALYGCSSLETLSFPYVLGRRTFGYLFGTNDYSGATAVVQYELTNPNTNSGSEYTYHIPSSLKKVIVAKGNIPYGAFRACRMIESIEFPQTESIGTGAFFQCSNLKNIYIPSSINKIGDYVFRECEKIESITVAEDNTVYHSSGNCLISTNSKSMLLGCKNSVIPNDGSVTNIDDAFYGCTGLTSITIPNCVMSISAYSFYKCYNLTIYCQAVNKPASWSNEWNVYYTSTNIYGQTIYTYCKVVWGAQ